MGKTYRELADKPNGTIAWWIINDLFSEETGDVPRDIVDVLGDELGGDAFLGFLAMFQLNGQVSAAAYSPTVRTVQAAVNEKWPNVTPPPADLVRFELREVFLPEDRALQLVPPPSPEFRANMRKLGYSDYWSDSFWAAHWELPSIERGFDMLHRLRPGRVVPGLVFTADDMRKLLKKQDVLPAYIDQIMAVSYAPLTRIDVRRMYKLGVLSKAQVKEAYMDLSYNEQNAGFLADFVEVDVRAEEKELSVSDWIASYREGLVTDEELARALVQMGYTEDGAAFKLELEQKRRANREAQDAARKAKQVSNVGRRVRRLSRSGKLDQDEVRAELEELDLSDVEISAFFANYVMQPLPVGKDLTRADELAAFRYGVTSEAELRERLLALKLDAREVDQLVRTEKARFKKPGVASRELSKADVLGLLKKQILAPEEAIERLVHLRYTEADAAALVIAASPVE